MNSLREIVFWGGPAVLLSWALLLALACVAVFRESATKKHASGLWHSGDVKGLDRE